MYSVGGCDYRLCVLRNEGKGVNALLWLVKATSLKHFPLQGRGIKGEGSIFVMLNSVQHLTSL